MLNTTRAIAALALALSLAVMPMAGCAGDADTSADASVTSPAQAASVDVSSWKTLGDALAAQTESLGSACDEHVYVAVIGAGDVVARVVADLEPGMYDKLNELDFLDVDLELDLANLIGGLELRGVEDITGDQLSQSELDALVGKRGQELTDDGFAFVGYNAYGMEGESAVTMDKGYFSYIVTFDATVTEDQTEDEGAAITDARVIAVARVGISDAALDLDARES